MSMICEGWAVGASMGCSSLSETNLGRSASSSICSISRHPIELKRISSSIVAFDILRDHTKINRAGK